MLIGTSTGGTLALKLAAEYPICRILLSPNIAINDPLAWVANNHWGLRVAHLIKGKIQWNGDTVAAVKQYLERKYRMEAVTELQGTARTTEIVLIWKSDTTGFIAVLL